MHEVGPFSIPAMRDFVPEKLRPWIVIFIVIIVQLSGGVYLAAVSEMVGSTALLQEDIMMAGYASMVGMGLTFAIMFRLKFRFPSKVALMTCGTVILIANLICMHTTSVPVLVVTCFFAGIFRMWATFECNSTIQLWLTPKRDLSIFFCYIYLLVQSCIQLSGLITIYTAFWSKWEYMHWVVIGLLLFMMILVMIVYRNFRTMPKIPLYGIDWIGAFMWGVILLCIIFVCIYGEHYDWYDSKYIWMATIGGLVTLILNRWRASFIRHPFIANQTWLYKATYLTFGLYIVVDILLAPSHLLEHIYMEVVLGYDMLHLISLNWVVFAGVVVGAFFTYRLFALRKWPYRTMIQIAFAAITGYLMMFYFTIDYNLPKEMLVLPIFLRSFGYVIVAICLLTYLSHVPFHHFFMAVSVQSFVSAGFGSVLGTAILGRALNLLMKKNAMLLGANLDHVHPLANHIPFGQLYGAVQEQALMVTLKELYGWLTLFGMVCLLVLFLQDGSERPFKALHPTYRFIRRSIKHELRVRHLWRR